MAVATVESTQIYEFEQYKIRYKDVGGKRYYRAEDLIQAMEMDDPETGWVDRDGKLRIIRKGACNRHHSMRAIRLQMRHLL